MLSMRGLIDKSKTNNSLSEEEFLLIAFDPNIMCNNIRGYLHTWKYTGREKGYIVSSVLSVRLICTVLQISPQKIIPPEMEVALQGISESVTDTTSSIAQTVPTPKALQSGTNNVFLGFRCLIVSGHLVWDVWDVSPGLGCLDPSLGKDLARRLHTPGCTVLALLIITSKTCNGKKFRAVPIL